MLTFEKVAEIKAKGIDFSDIPELTEEDFARGHFKYPEQHKAEVERIRKEKESVCNKQKLEFA